MSESSKLRVLLADDHQVVRRGLRAYLELTHDIEVIAEAADGGEAGHLYEPTQPDVILLDLHMEPIGGIAALQLIRARDPGVKALILTSFVDVGHVLPAVEAGAIGYLLKTSDPDEIVTAIRKAALGKSTFDADAMRAMADGLRHKSAESDLTERELTVLLLIAKGKSNQEIADELFIGLKTVKTHVSNVLAKLGVADRTQAAVYALRHGMA